MRTTVTIDDDIAAALELERKQKGLSFKQVVNSTLRRGLSAEAVLPGRKTVEVRPHDFGLRTGIDRDKMNQLYDELEAEEFLQGRIRGK